MSKKASQKTPEAVNILAAIQHDRREKIKELATQALANANYTKERARLSISQAMECGKLLIEEKMSLKKEGIRGKWMDFFNAHYGKILPISTAKGWMTLATKSENMPIENVTRKGMLALELFPAKVHIETTDVKKAKSAIFTSPAALVNKFCAWRKRFGERVPAGSLSHDELESLKLQFKPIIEFIDQLTSETLPEAASNKAAESAAVA